MLCQIKNMRVSYRNFFIGFAIAGIILLVDQLSKYYMQQLLLYPAPHAIEVLPFFNLVAVWNKGISFGLFQAGSPQETSLLIAIASAICLLLLYWLWIAKNNWQLIATSLILGGAIGNIIDRILYGAVFDFLDFHAYGWHWPAFNIADCCIVIGVALLIGESFCNPPTKEAKTTKIKD